MCGKADSKKVTVVNGQTSQTKPLSGHCVASDSESDEVTQNLLRGFEKGFQKAADSDNPGISIVAENMTAG